MAKPLLRVGNLVVILASLSSLAQEPGRVKFQVKDDSSLFNPGIFTNRADATRRFQDDRGCGKAITDRFLAVISDSALVDHFQRARSLLPAEDDFFLVLEVSGSKEGKVGSFAIATFVKRASMFKDNVVFHGLCNIPFTLCERDKSIPVAKDPASKENCAAAANAITPFAVRKTLQTVIEKAVRNDARTRQLPQASPDRLPPAD